MAPFQPPHPSSGPPKALRRHPTATGQAKLRQSWHLMYSNPCHIEWIAAQARFWAEDMYQSLTKIAYKGDTMAKAPRLFLIDGSALAYRSYFAFIRNPLINSKGENTSAVFGYTRTLLDILAQEKPEYIAVAFDTPEPTFRHERFANYKATRQKMPDEMSAQWPRLREVTEALGVTLIALPGFEADDVMGTLAKQAEREGFKIYLVTADKDLMQLVSPHVKIYSLRRVANQQEILDPVGVQQKFGVPPERVIDVLALMGDNSDNIPGVRGIGEKTAVKLMQDYGELETVLAKAAGIKPKGVADKILAHLDMARL